MKLTEQEKMEIARRKVAEIAYVLRSYKSDAEKLAEIRRIVGESLSGRQEAPPRHHP